MMHYKISLIVFRGVINGKAGKALPKFSGMLTLSQSGGRLCPTIGFASPKAFRAFTLISHLLSFQCNMHMINVM